MQLKQIKSVERLTLITLSALIIAIAIVIYTVYNLQFYIQRTDHTQQVINLSASTHQAVLATESNIRAYVITGEKYFYDEFNLQKLKTVSSLSQLHQLVHDNPEQQQNVTKLRSKVALRFSGFDTSAVMVSAGENINNFVPQRVKRSIALSNEITSLLNSIADTENDLLSARKTKLDNNIKFLSPLLVFVFITGVVISATLLYALRLFTRATIKYNEQIRQYQDDLKQQIKNLNETNSDLEQFAYVASHDLQEPLRKIVSFSELLQDTAAESLGEEGQMYLNRISSSARRMRNLIQDLLSYSRAGRVTGVSVTVDMNKVIEEVMDDLSLSISEKNAVIEKQSLPAVIGSFVPLKLVFQNLVSNALKFSRPGTAPVVTIAWQDAPQHIMHNYLDLNAKKHFCIITVSDNGIGFSEEFSSKIFIIFQRLHTRDQYDGTGIGLAICKKIIENLGGKIFAASGQGEGSVFTIILELA